jgi:hypothetical protein
MTHKDNRGELGSKKYLISSHWWNQWCDYVNFDKQDIQQPKQ